MTAVSMVAIAGILPHFEEMFQRPCHYIDIFLLLINAKRLGLIGWKYIKLFLIDFEFTVVFWIYDRYSVIIWLPKFLPSLGLFT